MEVGAVVLARMDSTRLPGKGLIKIGGVTLLERCISAVTGVKNMIPVLATTTRRIDDPLVKAAHKLGIKIFRGSLENVAKRVIDCCEKYDFKYFARINGDSPFINRELLQKAIVLIETEDLDFVTNLAVRTFPYGISVEIFKVELLRSAYKKWSSGSKYVEHITSYFYENKEDLTYRNISSDLNFSEEELLKIRLVVDTKEDLDIINKMYEADHKIFDADILSVCNFYNHIKS